MPKGRRTTIGHNPLEDSAPETPAAADLIPDAEPVLDAPIPQEAPAAVTLDAEAAADAPETARRSLVRRSSAAVTGLATSTKDTFRRRLRGDRNRSRDAIGGKLELLGGELGIKMASIQRYGEAKRVGFHAADGSFIDLQGQIATIVSRPDRNDFRIIEAVGWAVALGALIGVPGAVLGGGIRLLHPARMICEARLRDGRGFVARTDSVTMAALGAMARGTETA
jgi:hypothetical protein